MNKHILLQAIAPAVVGGLTAAVFVLFGADLMASPENHLKSILLFLWLFPVMMWCAYAVMQQGEALAEELGEPYGTLILTFSVIIIEVAMLASIMLQGDNNPTLARDAMFATLMIVLNGMVGGALIMGALRYWEQDYNLAGARLPGGAHGSGGLRPGPAQLYRDRARSCEGTRKGHSIRGDHASLLCGLRGHTNHAAPRLL
jgi:Ca2+:H+ antiporter